MNTIFVFNLIAFLGFSLARLRKYLLDGTLSLPEHDFTSWMIKTTMLKHGRGGFSKVTYLTLPYLWDIHMHLRHANFEKFLWPSCCLPCGNVGY